MTEQVDQATVAGPAEEAPEITNLPASDFLIYIFFSLGSLNVFEILQC